MAFANPVQFSTACAPLNRAAVLDRLGGDAALLREISAIFLAEYPLLLARIREAVELGQPAALERSAHALKGAVSNFGAAAATQAALELEIIGRQKRLADAPAAVAMLLECLRELEPQLTELLQ